MNGWLKIRLICMMAAFVLGLGTGGAAHALGHPQNVAKYRQAVMQSQAALMRAMGAVVKGQVGFTDHLTDQAIALYSTSRNLAALYPAGTGADKVKTRAQPEIWRDWSRFEAAAGNFTAEALQLVKISKSGDLKAFTVQFKAVAKSCGACHKPFRAKKKKDQK